jgi:hypothetical protein
MVLQVQEVLDMLLVVVLEEFLVQMVLVLLVLVDMVVVVLGVMMDLVVLHLIRLVSRGCLEQVEAVVLVVVTLASVVLVAEVVPVLC